MQYQFLELFHRHQNLARFRSFFLSYYAGLGQLVHDAGRPVKADLERSLEHSDGRFVLLNNELSCLDKVFVPAVSPPSTFGRCLCNLLFHLRIILGRQFLAGQKFYYLCHFLIRHKGTLYPLRFGIA